ncbi:NAD(P)-binding protein [Annulohypoxylon maeteangense]|uniref:NAD(P)-binding protein n=1 Tax=Annulohypoxylon maeteangense TaxID=1927788 RepID=UPI0020076141|nr:NAD(P)-binding protein [Annulohypoxylon maeteangense]KAI0881295.1 NAD(P)-binding protein [Annulohypoxylon maeteangense]
MAQNILITGAAGYVGGSVLAEFISRTKSPIKAANLHAAVRTEEQVKALSKLGVNVIQLDLSDEASVITAVLQNEIDIAIHTASSADSSLSSITTLFSEDGGWTYGEVKDSDPIYEKDKQIGRSHPARATNLLVIEQAKELGVTSFIVPVPPTYGRGTGEWRKLSVNIPAYVRVSIANKVVYKFDRNGSPPALHISDLVTIYALIVEKILQKEPIPSGEEGYYFAAVHRAPWWEIMQLLADGLYARGLVKEPKVQVWPSYDEAADQLGLPRLYVRAIGTSSGDLVPVHPYQLGWKPQWDQKRFLESMDDEIQAVLDLDTVKPTLFDSL